jgi:hypothetical protein
MPIHRTILSDGTLGYKWGTTGKPYKRLQDARNQEKAVYASGWREKKDQSVKDVCPECGKEKCECKKQKKDAAMNYTDLTKHAGIYGDYSGAVAQALAKNQPQALPMNALDAERLRTLSLSQEQRRIRHLKSLMGNDAATAYNRLGYTRILPTLAMTTAGAGLGGVAGFIADPDRKDAVVPGALTGGALGLLTSLLANRVGSFAGAIGHTDREKLGERLKNLGAADFLIPGRGAYLQAQLYKDFKENEDERPTQMVF